MRFEDMKYDFPKMPEEMRTMIEKEVAKQLQAGRARQKKGKRAVGKTLAASIAAVMLFSTTVFAGVSIYRIQKEQVGSHGVRVKVSDGETAGTDSAAAKEPAVIPNIKMEAGYLPDGMVQTEQGKYSFENALHKGGVSIVFYRMDTGDGQFEMLHKDVLSSEDITVNGHDGVYLEYPHLYQDEITFNQRIYVAYADIHYVMEMYAASDVPKQEALKIAEGIQLTPTKDIGDAKLVRAWDWSAYLAGKAEDQQKQENQDNQDKETDFAARNTVSKEEMKNTHAIGERFLAADTGLGQNAGLMVKVSSVQVSDDISLLDPAFTDEDLKNELDADGKLRPAEIQYIKSGGLDSVSEVVKSRSVPQKLVYAAVEYTNAGDKELTDVLFMGTLARMQEEGGLVRMLWTYEEPAAEDTWTMAVNRGLSSLAEMRYFDVHGGEQNNNYIASIKPGETVTVHMGWIVTEEELGKLYLSLDTAGGGLEFSDSGLALGYVDIRRQD